MAQKTRIADQFAQTQIAGREAHPPLIAGSESALVAVHVVSSVCFPLESCSIAHDFFGVSGLIELAKWAETKGRNLPDIREAIYGRDLKKKKSASAIIVGYVKLAREEERANSESKNWWGLGYLVGMEIVAELIIEILSRNKVPAERLNEIRRFLMSNSIYINYISGAERRSENEESVQLFTGSYGEAFKLMYYLRDAIATAQIELNLDGVMPPVASDDGQKGKNRDIFDNNFSAILENLK